MKIRRYFNIKTESAYERTDDKQTSEKRRLVLCVIFQAREIEPFAFPVEV